MGKLEAVAARKSVLLSAQDVAVEEFGGGCYDDGVASVPPGDADEQAKIDAAVAAAVEPLNVQIADLMAKDVLDMQAAVDVKAAGDAAVAVLQAQFDSLTSKEGAEASIIANLQGSLSILKDVVEKLSALPAIP